MVSQVVNMGLVGYPPSEKTVELQEMLGNLERPSEKEVEPQRKKGEHIVITRSGYR